MSTLKSLRTRALSRRDGRPAFTLLELIVVLLVLGVLAAIAVPTFNTVKENSVERVAQTTLEAIDRNGEAIAVSDPDLSDSQIAELALSEIDPPAGLTITRDGVEITVGNSSGSITAEGTVTFSGGVGTIVDATVISGSPSTTASPTTTAAPTTTVASVSYAVGDTGPGGGIIFYVAATPFTCGATLSATCTYLEAAPTGWNGGSDPGRMWSSNTNTLVGTSEGIGFGYQNTLAAVAQDSTSNRAITLADAYSNNGYSDWFLPSKDEVNELCKYARNTGQAAGAGTACEGGSRPHLVGRGFESNAYWSSTEFSATEMWYRDFWRSYADPTMDTFSKAQPTILVRPVRAG